MQNQASVDRQISSNSGLSEGVCLLIVRDFHATSQHHNRSPDRGSLREGAVAAAQYS